MKKILPFFLIALTSCSRYAASVQPSVITGFSKGRIQTTAIAKAMPVIVKIGDTLQVITRKKI